ncbi:MAG: SpoIIE family protein phosphatase [Spirochaetaceae bacterium]|nr:SpoIIE family protein phosphatase [Spirochaetaceae bacterium]
MRKTLPFWLFLFPAHFLWARETGGRLLDTANGFVFDVTVFILGGLLLFCAAGLVFALRGIILVITEGSRVRLEAAALVSGDIMPLEKKKRAARLKKRGIGLYPKLTSFTIVLVFMVVIMVSVPLYIRMTVTQRQTLFESLKERVEVLLQGLDDGVRVYLAGGNLTDLNLLPRQISAISEAKYATITGYSAATPVFDDLVLATNDPDILSKIDTPEFQPGISRLTDALSPRLEQIAAELNRRARTEAGSLVAGIAELNRQAAALAPYSDELSRDRFRDMQLTIRALEIRLNNWLNEISREIGSEPAYFSEGLTGMDTSRLVRAGRDQSRTGAFNGTFIFYRPIMYRQGNEDYYFRCLIRLEVTIEPILNQITKGQRGLLTMILLVAGFAQIIGAIGALILSTWIIRPVRKLVTFVELIRDTEDKSKLKGVEIRLNSRDELAVLGNTINDMTAGLVRAAEDSRDLTIGKEVQKKFIPLETDRDGNKLSSGFKDIPTAQFYGYYEGAKGISGDYFDYIDLDDRYYAIIKCDVAGKGVPAALIMIQVATMFLNHFKNWTSIEEGQHIEELVYQINDFIEALGFEGRFAAFTLCLFDSKTGLLRFCNAGDNIIHYYDKSDGRMKSVKFRETPAVGVLPNFLVKSKGGYTVKTMTLDHGDILFLYTDGIEEAKRKFRDSSFNEIVCNEGDAPVNTPHGNHVVGQGNEELGRDRVEAIINAVMNQRTYSLYKYHNAEGEQALHFDFTTCEGTVEEAVTALVSVEKIFRIYKNPSAGEDDRVLVDREVDKFLKAHFLQYRTYCTKSMKSGENNAYLYYTHIMEDPQYDDLTIVGIMRK